MAKKIALLMIVVLIVSACLFVSCGQTPGGGGNKPNPSGVDIEVRDPLEENTYDGTVIVLTDPDLESDYYDPLYNMNFDSSTDSSDARADGSNTSIVEGAGVGNTNALRVETPTYNYGCIYVDLTPYYAEGKSFYVEASLKDNGSTNTTDLKAYFSYTVCSGAVKDAFDEEYDCDDIYGAPFMDEDEATLLLGDDAAKYPTRGTLVPIALKADEYITVSGIIPAVEIDEMIVNQTKLYAQTEEDEPSLEYLYVCFQVGDYPNQKDRDFYIDNIVIVDLNGEIEPTGKTHFPQATV